MVSVHNFRIIVVVNIMLSRNEQRRDSVQHSIVSFTNTHINNFQTLKFYIKMIHTKGRTKKKNLLQLM